MERIVKTLDDRTLKPVLKEAVENKKLLMDYETDRLGSRGIARSTDERTLIAAMIHARKFLMNSLPYIDPFTHRIDNGTVTQSKNTDYSFYLLALLNSFVLDYYIRQRVSANLNFFFVYELPIPDKGPVKTRSVIEMSKQISEKYDKGLRAKLEIYVSKELFGINAE